MEKIADIIESIANEKKFKLRECKRKGSYRFNQYCKKNLWTRI